MVTVWMVRHGETGWNALQRFQGWSDIPLNSVGRAQAHALREVLVGANFDGVWSSDLSRAVETAQIAHTDPTRDARLRELDFGDIEGLTWGELSPEVQLSLQMFDGFEAPNGESMAGFTERVEGFFDDLKSGRHLVFTHGGVVRAIVRACGGDGFPGHTDVIKVNWSGRTMRSRYRRNALNPSR